MDADKDQRLFIILTTNVSTEIKGKDKEYRIILLTIK
jgi:hypothetical protein